VSNWKNKAANLEPFPVIPANRRRAEAALCRVAKAEAGIQYFQQVLDPAPVFTGVTRRDDGVWKYP